MFFSKMPRILFSFILLLGFLFSSISFAGTEDIRKMKVEKPIVVDGDMVEYFEEDGRIVAEGNVVVNYEETKLTCDHMVVNTITRKALCTGNVKVEQEDGTLVGERIEYDFIKERGEILSGEVEAFPWYGKAEESEQVGDNEFLLKKGYITTCDLDTPHYRVKGKEIRIFPDDKIIAKNVTFLIRNIPVLWFPYYYHPIIQSRAKVQFIPGTSSEWGNFLLSTWRFYMKGNTKIDIFADYRGKKGIAGGADVYYDMKDAGAKELGKGLFRSYFIGHNHKLMAQEPNDENGYRDSGFHPVTRKRFQWKHRLDFDKDTVGILEFNKFSDKELFKEYFYKEFEETKTTPTSFISIISAKPNYIFEIEANRRFHDFYTVTQKLPAVNLDVLSQSLWGTPFYYNGSANFTKFSKAYERTINSTSDSAFLRTDDVSVEQSNRFDFFYELGYTAKAGPVSLRPYGNVRETGYDRTRWGRVFTPRTTFSAGLDATTRFFRVFNFSTNFLGLDINRLRHLVTPSAQYFHTHQPTVDMKNLYQMDAIDGLEKRNGVALSLENKLQTKRFDAAGNSDSIDLVRSIASINYYFCAEKGRFELDKNGPYRKHGRFRDLTFDTEIKPYDWLFIESFVTVNSKIEAIKTGDIEVAVEHENSLRVAARYLYEKRIPEPTKDFLIDVAYRLNPKWYINVYERVNWNSRIIEEQQLSLTRDLHCWEVELVYNVAGSRFLKDEYTIWLAFKIKAFPDLPIGLKSTFRKRPPGSYSPREKYQNR